MKSLKINDNKIKDIVKKGVALISIISTIMVVWGCNKKQENNNSAYVKTMVIDGLPTTIYNGKNLALAIDKETFEIKKYILHDKDISNKTYNLEQDYITAAGFIITSPDDYNVSSTEIILDDYFVVLFVDIEDYVEGHKLKDYYTLDEIISLEPSIVESIKKINEYSNSNQKIKNN